MLGRRRHALWAWAFAATALAACTGAGPTGTTAPPPSTPPPTPGALATAFRFDVCALLPDADVQAAAAYPIPFDYSEGPNGDACAYYFSDHDHAEAAITVGANAYPTAQEITDGILVTVNNYNLDGWPTETVSGVGDEAWWLCQVEDFGECTLYVREGTYEVSVQTTPSELPPLDNDTRKGVAIALANIVLGRLP